MKRSSPRPRPNAGSGAAPAPARESAKGALEDSAAAIFAERARRVALGLVVALLTARAFWPSEPDLKSGAGAGLSWVLLLITVSGVALAGSLIGGCFRCRWSWTDAAVVALAVLAAMSAGHAADRRTAINLAWDWVGIGLAYVLLRNLPRSRRESSAIAGALVATAFAVSVYGLYQNKVELPLIQEQYRRNPLPMLRKLNIEPGSRGQLMFENRLMHSTEPWSTFALANSLAGFIVGPLVIGAGVMLQNLVRREGPRTRLGALAVASAIGLVVLICLILTKSRSAYVGATVALVLLAWRVRREVPPRLMASMALAGLIVVAAVIIAGLKTGRLDREVLTQSKKSLMYRSEFWRGAWSVITNGAPTLAAGLSAPTFWNGVGPGNFGAPYLRYKLPESSEEIVDPHNMFLDVWATAGVGAFLALVAALGCALWNLLIGQSSLTAPADLDRVDAARSGPAHDSVAESRSMHATRPAGAQTPAGGVMWLLFWAGFGGWATVVALGQLNPFQGDLFFRWLILGMAWMLAVLAGAPLWSRQTVAPVVLGAGVVAASINLLAAGGIAIPTVALALWSMVALGLNLCENHKCGQLHEWESRMPAFVLAVGWSAVLGTFFGLVAPFWRAEQAIAAAEDALTRRPPDFARADEAYKTAIEADRYFTRPWHELAILHFRVWQDLGARVEQDGSRWDRATIPWLYQMATTPPRSPESWSLHAERASAAQQLLRQVASRLTPIEVLRCQAEIVEATRTASLLYPTNADLHARLADASAEIGIYGDAVTEGTEALRLDEITPHADRKLPAAVRERLKALIPKWSESAAKMPIKPAP